MSSRNSGFILLMTLLIIMVLSLLTLTGLHHLMLYYKASNRLEERHQNVYQLEQVALELAATKYSDLDKNCVINKDSANQVISQLRNNEGCSLVLGKKKYQYLIEELNELPCLIVLNGEGTHSTHHRRVSLMLLNSNGPNSILQIRYLTSIPHQPCMGTEHIVSAGISSWRYVAAL